MLKNLSEIYAENSKTKHSMRNSINKKRSLSS